MLHGKLQVINQLLVKLEPQINNTIVLGCVTALISEKLPTIAGVFGILCLAWYNIERALATRQKRLRESRQDKEELDKTDEV